LRSNGWCKSTWMAFARLCGCASPVLHSLARSGAVYEDGLRSSNVARCMVMSCARPGEARSATRSAVAHYGAFGEFDMRSGSSLRCDCVACHTVASIGALWLSVVRSYALAPSFFMAFGYSRGGGPALGPAVSLSVALWGSSILFRKLARFSLTGIRSRPKARSYGVSCGRDGCRAQGVWRSLAGCGAFWHFLLRFLVMARSGAVAWLVLRSKGVARSSSSAAALVG